MVVVAVKAGAGAGAGAVVVEVEVNQNIIVNKQYKIQGMRKKVIVED